MYQGAVEHFSLITTSSESEDEGCHERSASRLRAQFLLYKRKTAVWRVVAILSICLNLPLLPLLYTYAIPRICEASGRDPAVSEYAHLSWNMSGQWLQHTMFYDTHHKTQTGQNWDALEWEHGVVALSDEEVEEMSLPWSPRLPWDGSKGVYVVNAYHNLHCLAWLWRSLSRFQEGITFEGTDWHGFHCLEHLRQDTLCYADDTPIKSRRGDLGHSDAGDHDQDRRCRDFGKLDQWVRERSACYRFLTSEVKDPLDRHKFCPEGSPYNKKIEDYYGPNEHQRLIDVYGDVAA